VELIVISRSLWNFTYSCITLCHINSRKYLSPYLQDGCTVLCCHIVALWRQKLIGHFIETKGHL